MIACLFFGLHALASCHVNSSPRPNTAFFFGFCICIGTFYFILQTLLQTDVHYCHKMHEDVDKLYLFILSSDPTSSCASLSGYLNLPKHAIFTHFLHPTAKTQSRFTCTCVLHRPQRRLFRVPFLGVLVPSLERVTIGWILTVSFSGARLVEASA